MSCVCACADNFMVCVFPFASVRASSVLSASLALRAAETAEKVGRFIIIPNAAVQARHTTREAGRVTSPGTACWATIRSDSHLLERQR